jgi:competence protein ComEC
MLAGWIVVGVAAESVPLTSRARPLRCSFIAVGHGLSVLVELPDGRRMLYDAGCLGPPARAGRAVAAVLWARGITHLDAMIISHGDLDHYNAVPTVLEQFSVGRIYVPPTMYADPNPATEALQQAIDHSGVPVETVWAGHRFDAGEGGAIRVLHPTRRGTPAAGDNANSLVVLVEYAGRRILLTGDLEPPGLDDVLAEEPVDCDVVLAPHHGGRRSNTPALARWCTPDWVVVSGSSGRGRFEELHKTYAEHGARLIHTGQRGTVTVELHREGVHVDGFLPP